MTLWEWVKSKLGFSGIIRGRLELGMRGEDVRTWQKVAMKHDGIFGPVTVAATRAFEFANGLPDTGVVTAMHWTIASKYKTGQATTDYTSLVRSDYPTRHHWARAIILAGFRQSMGRAATLREAQFAQAVALGESSYGRGWKDAGVGSFNWGAVQAGRPPCDPARSFPYGDTHEAGQPYAACFRKYASDVDGAADFIRIMMKPNVLSAANGGSIEGVSSGMRANHYFELALDKHIIALTRNLKEITTALGEPMPSSSGSGGGGLIAGLLTLGLAIPIVAFLKR
jgi:hypothetical protein